MKCIKYTGSLRLKTDDIERVSDLEAQAAVKSGLAVFVSKSAWKAWRKANEAAKLAA